MCWITRVGGIEPYMHPRGEPDACLLQLATPADPATFGFVLAVLGTVGLAASLIPAWRASRAHPSETLRAG